jgi:hypothetical protein
MAAPNVSAGIKTAKLLAARLVQSPKTGNVAVEFSFSFIEPSTNKSETMPGCMWIYDTDGNLSKNTQEKLVSVLGWNKSRDVNERNEFTDPKAFAYGREVQLEVEITEDTDDKGRVWKNPKVKWINSLGGSGYSECDVDKVKAAFDALGALPAKVENKAPTGKTTPKETPKLGIDEEEEVPF